MNRVIFNIPTGFYAEGVKKAALTGFICRETKRFDLPLHNGMVMFRMAVALIAVSHRPNHRLTIPSVDKERLYFCRLPVLK
jgi:hypothetical protein